jgi:hypothetical protein
VNGSIFRIRELEEDLLGCFCGNKSELLLPDLFHVDAQRLHPRHPLHPPRTAAVEKAHDLAFHEKIPAWAYQDRGRGP